MDGEGSGAAEADLHPVAGGVRGRGPQGLPGAVAQYGELHAPDRDQGLFTLGKVSTSSCLSYKQQACFLGLTSIASCRFRSPSGLKN